MPKGQERLPGFQTDRQGARPGVRYPFREYECLTGPTDLELRTGRADRDNLHIMSILAEAINQGYLDGNDEEAVRQAIAELRGYQQEELPDFNTIFSKPTKPNF